MRVPTNDIHLLVVKFANDVFDPLSSEPDAGADRIDLLVAGPNCEFGAKARFAGDTFDFDGSIVDFGNFELEQLDDKSRISAGQNDFRAVGTLLYCFHIATNALANLVFLGRHAFTVWQQGFILA